MVCLKFNYVNPLHIYTRLLCLQVCNFWTFLVCMRHSDLQGSARNDFLPVQSKQKWPVKAVTKKTTWLKNELEMMHWDYQLWSDQLFRPHFFTKGKDMQNIHLYMFRPPVWSLELYVTQQLISRKQRKCHFPIVFLVLKPSSPGRSASLWASYPQAVPCAESAAAPASSFHPCH